MTVAPTRDYFKEAGAGSSAASTPMDERGPRSARKRQPEPASAQQPVAVPGVQDPLPALQQRAQPIKPPTGPPVPALAAHGYHGSIVDFNERVQQTVEAHTQATGQPPPPGLVLSVAASPVPTESIPHLFTAPRNQFEARTASVANQARAADAAKRAQSPDDWLYQRSDGLHQMDNPIRRLVETERQARYSNIVGGPTLGTPLPARYPWVAEGGLPIAGVEDLYQAIRYLNEQGGKDLQVVSQGQSLPEFEKEAARGGAVDAATRQAIGSAQQNETPAPSLIGGQADIPGGAENRARAGIATVAQAQRDLNREMGTTLPVTGFFDQDWTKALGNWMQSADYFRRQTEFQAENAGYGKNVDAYVKAWKAKQDSVQQHGAFSHFLAAMPLQLFGHQGALGVADGLWDFVSQGRSPLDPTFYSPTTGLHSLTRTGSLVLNVVGGTVAEAKAWAATGNEFAKTMAPHALGGKAGTLDEAKANAARVLRAHPSWLRVFAPDAPDSAVDSVAGRIADVAGDLILLGKPRFTGERLSAGNVTAAQKSRYLNAAARWAYRDLATYGKDGIGRAASRLESGQGARALVARAAPLVKTGELSEEQFAQHVAELYSHGTTTIAVRGAEAEIHGPLLASLRSEKLPAPGMHGRAWLQAKSGLRASLDDFDTAARDSSVVGTDTAANLAATVRSTVAHAAPRGPRGFFDDTLPENVFNFVIKHKLGDDVAATANRLESQLVRFQGTENVVGIQSVQRKLESLYREKHPLTDGGVPDDPFEATLATEAPSVFKFPGAGEQEIDGALAGVENAAKSVNRFLNRLAVMHSRIILSGFPIPGGGLSLFWKHAIGDTLRTEVGGGGIAVGFAPEVRAAKQEIEGLANADPALSRKLGAFRQRAVMGETRWLLNRGGSTFATSFSTAEKFGKHQYMDAAGGYLRRLVDDDALTAYLGGNPQDLVDLVLKNRTYRGMWKSAQRRAAAAGEPVPSAEDYADAVAARFHDAQDALSAQGLSLDDARAAMQASRGAKVDHELGKWLEQNRVDMEVKNALVQPTGTFDDLTGRYIGNVVMRPNKLNRGRFSENVLAKTYAELSKTMEPRDALDVSLDLSARLTKYHMLDFANRLQVEQDLRWVSYFATKHRLYWKWLVGTFLRQPKYAAAVDSFRQNLDDHGNLGSWHVFGIPVTIPAARLVWVPGKEYSEVSPPAQFVLAVAKAGGDLSAGFQAASGTLGNVVSRSDTAIRLGFKLGAMGAGKQPATYGAATSGLDPRTASRVRRALNEYQTSYMDAHGHYAPEADAVRHVLWAQTAEELWRANLPLPVVPSNLEQATAEQKQMGEYMLLTDPKARRAYLDKHPGVADLFGIYGDPNVYLHNRDLFGRYTSALDGYRAGRAHLYEQARTGGMTPEIVVAKRQLDEAFKKRFNKLLQEDAKFAGIDTHGSVPDGINVPYGPWGKVAAADPQLDPRNALNALFPKLKRSEDFRIYGTLQKQLQQELTLLNDPKYTATFDDPSEVKTRRREILSQLDVFRRYPTDALGKVQLAYQRQYVDPFWKSYDARYQKIVNLPKAEKDAAYADLRSWKDSQDKPVTISVDNLPPLYRLAGKQPGLVKGGNLDLNHRPVVHNADGSISTVRTISVGTDGGEVLIPTVIGDRVVSNEEAIAHYKQTGENFGTFASVDAANRYAQALHREQAKTSARSQTVTFPSPLQMAWATLDPATKQQRLASLAAGTWDHLADYEKRLLGHDPGSRASEGWRLVGRFYDDAKAKLAPGARIPSAYKQTLAKYVDRYYVKGFYHDWLFAQQPRFQRLERLDVVTGSRHADQWHQLLRVAGQYYSAYVKTPGHTGVSEAWHRYVKTSLEPWVDSQPAFAKEVAMYGPDLLYTLIS